MDNSQASGPLTEDELDRLENFLDAIGPPAMSIETLDGYFAALICGPEMVLPSEYLPEIWGPAFAFSTNQEANDIMSLVMRHWNTIASALLLTLQEPDVYLPVLLEDKEGVAHGNAWAQGFMRGVRCRAASWGGMVNSEEHGGPMLPIMLLAHEHDPDPAMRPEPITPEKREELLQMMIGALTVIYRYFEPHRRAGTSAPHEQLRRVGPKVGRNEPCPCGSGKKYKWCCAAGAPTVH